MSLPPEPEIAGLIEQARVELLALCEELERLADALPDSGVRQTCIHLARSVGPTISRWHRLEEDVLFPALTARGGTQSDLAGSIERLKRDHYEDECFAEELQGALLGYGSGSSALSADAIGYMLRGFFSAKRRHIAFEQEILKPLLGITGERRESPPSG